LQLDRQSLKWCGNARESWFVARDPLKMAEGKMNETEPQGEKKAESRAKTIRASNKMDLCVINRASLSLRGL
jgi:hypothetical protein